jgi:hypothetical protein
VRLSRCPACKTILVAGKAACPHCGCDLAWVRAEIARLVSPSITWTPDRVVALAPFRALTPSARRDLLAYLRAARRASDT